MSYSSTLEVPGTMTGHPHNYSGDMVERTFVSPFLFTHADHERERFRAGTYKVPIEVGNHWFAMAHTDEPVESAPVPGTSIYNERLRKDGLAANARLREQQNQDMTRAAMAQRKAIEDDVRVELAGKVRAEMQAEFDARLAASVKEAVAAALAQAQGPMTTNPPGTADASAKDQGADTPKDEGQLKGKNGK